MTPRLLEQPPPAPARPATRPPRRRRIGDEQLAGRVADRHDAAFAALYERYHQPLYRYCRSLLHDDADAQDALQSTFTSALVALRAGRRDAPLRPWLFRIAHNEAISLVRRRRVDGHGQELSESLLPSVPSAADEAGARARLALLVADLTHLPDRQRSALVMRELCGLSHEEIAVALGTSTTAAKQAIFEARTALSEFAEGRAATCEEIRSRLSEQDGRMLRNRRASLPPARLLDLRRIRRGDRPAPLGPARDRPGTASGRLGRSARPPRPGQRRSGRLGARRRRGGGRSGREVRRRCSHLQGPGHDRGGPDDRRRRRRAELDAALRRAFRPPSRASAGPGASGRTLLARRHHARSPRCDRSRAPVANAFENQNAQAIRNADPRPAAGSHEVLARATSIGHGWLPARRQEPGQTGPDIGAGAADRRRGDADLDLEYQPRQDWLQRLLAGEQQRRSWS